MTCSTCGRARCAYADQPPHEAATAGGGDNGLTAAELEVVALRSRVAELERHRCSALTVLVQCRFWMQHQLPMGSGGGLDSTQNKVREAMLARIDEALR